MKKIVLVFGFLLMSFVGFGQQSKTNRDSNNLPDVIDSNKIRNIVLDVIDKIDPNFFDNIDIHLVAFNFMARLGFVYSLDVPKKTHSYYNIEILADMADIFGGFEDNVYIIYFDSEEKEVMYAYSLSKLIKRNYDEFIKAIEEQDAIFAKHKGRRFNYYYGIRADNIKNIYINLE